MTTQRAPTTPCFEELAVGDELPSLRHLLTRTDLVRYAGASGDFNPMHHDEVLAQAAAQPSVFGHGMYSMGLLASALTGFAGVGSVVAYRVRFTRQTWPGETLVTVVRVASKRVENGRPLLDVDCSLVNDGDEIKLSGTATLDLSRSLLESIPKEAECRGS